MIRLFSYPDSIVSMFFLKKLFKNAIRFIKQLISRNRTPHDSQWESLTVLPGIGLKNARFFFDAGFRRPEDVLSASDEKLLSIPGVGRNFLKRLRAYK